MIHNFAVISNDDLVEKEFGDTYRFVRKYTGATHERLYALFKSVEYVVKNNIEGDFVECGVANGGCVMIIAKTLVDMGVTDRKIYLYDTFEGMPKPSAHDYTWGSSPEKMMQRWFKKTDSEGKTNWVRFTLDEVKANMKLTGYPEENLVFVKGMVEETIPGTIPEKISLLRLDTDFYESTKHKLEHLYPRVSKGGVLLLDDYGTWMGEKKAADDYFKDNPILLNRVDRDGRVGVKF